jgi:hypothetical protein
MTCRAFVPLRLPLWTQLLAAVRVPHDSKENSAAQLEAFGYPICCSCRHYDGKSSRSQLLKTSRELIVRALQVIERFLSALFESFPAFY